ncbi:uracil-DNA glycosylase family protein [Vagococcus teuberi]|uniref:uracil-DNA glycosylase family protein n=1 Tax=Vagococcus TaxID=2737 RepID=UPI0008F8FFC1|nr:MULTISPECIES: uracil-DNA glycosylase family protein [Vagococcus]RHH71046.1 uracil-DNA glycosylase family protein [Vagococcus sp. AM17-17]
MSRLTIEEIRQQIIHDPDNASFTEKGWQPVFMAYPEAKILIIGQAPGIKTQEKEQVFRDKSGEKLREWMGVTDDIFYDSKQIAVLPLDFYFPGKAAHGDLPPRKNFTEKWHPSLIECMPNIELTILMGTYAQKYYLKDKAKKTLTETVFAYEEYLPTYFPIVHSSPLNFRWFAKHPEFESAIVPVFKAHVQKLIK